MQNMRNFWWYEQQHDLALQKHFHTNARRFHSFPTFPQHICEDLYEEYAPEALEEAAYEEVAPKVPTRSPKATHPAPIAPSSR